MVGLTTNFNIPPYFDDYSEDKNYYRILFRPRYAVQARELTQLQTILQNQISKFANHIFKDGTIVEGCPITYLPNLKFVRFNNSFNNDVTRSLVNTIIPEGVLLVAAGNNANGVRATASIAKSGFLSNFPATNRVYLNYIKTGTSNTNTDVQEFSSGEVIHVYNSNQSKLGTLSSNNLIDTITVMTANVSANSVGTAYGVRVGEGIIYQKGFFSKVTPHTITVKDYDLVVNNHAVGFETRETIVTEFADLSLQDNAQGFSNSKAPGAHRLRLDSTLVSKDKSNTDLKNFFSIAEFDGNSPTEQKVDTAYNKLGDEFARRTYEESGNYIVKPFIIETLASANSQTMNYQVSSGVGYTSGHRVELLSSRKVEVERASTFDSINNLSLSASYGNYVVCDDIVGIFDSEIAAEVDLFDAAQNALASAIGSGGGNVGSLIGKANVVSITPSSGIKDKVTAQSFVYLTNIRMNSGQSFTSVRGLVQVNALNTAKADLVLESGLAVLKSSTLSNLIFPLGVRSVRNVSDVSYMFQQVSTGTLNANGFLSISTDTAAAGGSERLIGPINTDVLKSPYSFAFTANTFTANLAGTVSITSGNATIVGTGTSFNTLIANGDIIRVYANSTNILTRTAVLVTNATSITLDSTVAVTNTSSTWARVFVAGQNISTLGANAALTLSSNTQFTASFAFGANLNSSQTVVAQYPVQRIVTTPTQKNVRKDGFVRIDCSNNSATATGPWNLGIPDVYGVQVFVGGTYSVNNPDRTSWFNLNNGQKDFIYDHASLIIKPEFASNITSANRILVRVSHFTANNTLGTGYFNVNSYPVDDSIAANTAITIRTAEIGRYSTQDSDYSLRDVIDFRFSRPTTATISANATVATINPAANNLLTTTGKYITLPGVAFNADVEYFLPRVDIVCINKNGDIAVKRGVPSRNPLTPSNDEDSCKIAEVFVPPYPSLTQREGETFNNSVEATKVNITSSKRYTMRDIGTIDDRVKRLEYYTVLSALEKKASDANILDTSGLDRFKNGIFADPFNSHIIGNVGDFEYKISIDAAASVARPKFKSWPVDFKLNTALSTNIQRVGSSVTLPFTSEPYITQRFATKVRNLTGALWQWNGKINLFPVNDYFKDEKRLAGVNTIVDNTAAAYHYASLYGTQYGEWRTISQVTASNQRVSGQATFEFGDWRPAIVTTTTSTDIQTRSSLAIAVDVSATVTDLGDSVSDITINPYMRGRMIAFTAFNMKPNTTVFPFFDDINVSAFCAQGVLSGNPAPLGREDVVVNRTKAFGTSLVSNSQGFVCGVFSIPEGVFRVGDRQFILTNTNNLTVGVDAKITVSSATYSASNVTVTRRGNTLTTLNATTRVVETGTETRGVVTGSNQTVEFYDPMAQTFFTNMPGTTSGIFVPEIDVFFQTVDPTLGCTVYLMEVNATVPDSTMILGKAYRPASYLTTKTSTNGSLAANFIFDQPVYLASNREYCFMVEPDANSPEFNIWLGEAGGTDLISGEQVFANPNAGVCFISSNRVTWTAIQKEDIKFILRRARFTATSGTVVFENENDDRITIDSFIGGNNSLGAVAIGDRVFVTASANTANTANNSPAGIVQSVDIVDGKLVLDTNISGFAANTRIGFYRPIDTTNPIYTSNTLVAVANVSTVDDIKYHAVVPQMSTITPLRTTLNYIYTGTNGSRVIDSIPTTIIPNRETELFDYERLGVSFSSEVSAMAGNKSSRLSVTLSTEDSFMSPVVDLSRKSVLFIQNLINNSSTNEHTRYGAAEAKYISRNIVLADNQDAEDLKVYVSAYRPIGSNILVYAKFLNGSDGQRIEDKVWTLLSYVEGSNVFSVTGNTTNFIEYSFSVPSIAPDTNAANLNISTGILEYVSTDNAIYRSYKSFCIKIVLLSSDGSKVPILSDVRGIALQV